VELARHADAARGTGNDGDLAGQVEQRHSYLLFL
jgi:hypothetical protein